VCVLLNVEPVFAKGPDGKYANSYWVAAIGPKVLGDPHLPHILVTFDRNKLT